MVALRVSNSLGPSRNWRPIDFDRRIHAVNEFRKIDTQRARIHLIEAGPRLVPAFREKQSDYTLRRLEKMGVEVHLDTKVSEIKADKVIAGDQSFEV